jgi:AcrR family transcriptional regulator
VPRDARSSTDRRVRRTRQALQDAFVALVLEEGYDQVGVDAIATRADVARPTFYAHYTDKNDLLTEVFTSLIEDLGRRLAFPSESQTTVRTEAVEEIYRHAGEFRDLYRVSLGGAGDGRARDAYLDLVTEGAERNFSERIEALRTTPRVPVPIMARAFAGAHLAVLRSWLEDEIDMPADQLAATALNLIVAGWAWGHGIEITELQLASEAGAEGAAETT